MLAADRTIDHGSAGLDRDAAGRAWRHRAVDDGKSGLISSNIFYYLTNELFVPKGKANVHNVAAVKRRSQINIYPESLMPHPNNLKQRFAHLAETDDNYCLAYLHHFLVIPETV